MFVEPFELLDQGFNPPAMQMQLLDMFDHVHAETEVATLLGLG